MLTTSHSKCGVSYAIPSSRAAPVLSDHESPVRIDSKRIAKIGGLTPISSPINFRGAGAHVIDLDQKARQVGAFVTRVPIRQEEVTFKNGEVTLAGTLVTPAAKGKRPAIVFTHGGGPAVREVFWGLGHLFAARGFVVRSYHKRGVGKRKIAKIIQRHKAEPRQWHRIDLMARYR